MRVGLPQPLDDATHTHWLRIFRSQSSADVGFFRIGQRHASARMRCDGDEPRDTRAVRAYEKAGFRPIQPLLGRTGDALIMQYELN